MFLDNFQISQQAADKARQVAVDSTAAAVSTSTHLLFDLSLFIYLFVGLFVCLFVCLFACLYVSIQALEFKHFWTKTPELPGDHLDLFLLELNATSNSE